MLESLPDHLGIVLRSTIVYTVVLIAFRLAGKKHVAQLSIIDFVLILLVSNAVQSSMVGEDISLVGGIIAALTLVGLNVILTKLIVRIPLVAHIVEGEPVLLVRNGKILNKQLKRESVRVEEIHEAMHKEGVAHLGDVALAILETDGGISIIRKERNHDENGR